MGITTLIIQTGNITQEVGSAAQTKGLMIQIEGNEQSHLLKRVQSTNMPGIIFLLPSLEEFIVRHSSPSTPRGKSENGLQIVYPRISENKTEKAFVTSSASALSEFLGLNELILPKVLVIHDKTSPYEPARLDRQGPLERLRRDSTDSIQSPPKNLKSVQSLQFAISPNSDQIIHMIANLLLRKSFPALISLDLRFNPTCQAVIEKETLWLEQKNVTVYRALIDQMYGIALAEPLKKVTHLGLTLWLDTTKYALAALGQQYPRLKSLTIDSVMPTHTLKQAQAPQLERIYSVGDFAARLLEQKKLTELVKNEDAPKQPTLMQILEKDVANSQLERLELYDFDHINKIPRFAYKTLNEFINAGLLPALTDIVIQPHPFSPHPEEPLNSTDDQAKDRQELLLSILEKKLPIKRLHLLITQIDGYQPWLDEIENGSFPDLTELYYVMPVMLAGEPPAAYSELVKMTLNSILNAVQKGKAPNLKQVVIIGEVLEEETSAPYIETIQKIQDLVSKQR